MKTYDIREMAAGAKEGEYVLGSKDLETHACYMIYGTLAPGEEGRLVKPGSGHEEIVLCARGRFKVSGPGLAPVREIELKEGSAFHVAGESELYLKNPTGEVAVYIMAGGHSEGGHN